MHYIAFYTFMLLIAQSVFSVLAEYLIYSTTGVIGAENITHVKLGKEGTFRVELISIQGDADLYVSDKTLHPDYLNYELQSTTCGKDVIRITEELIRPVGIGVYGHASYEQSMYQLDVYKEDGVASQGYEDFLNADDTSSEGSRHRHKGEEEESLLWTIFVGILKILFDILV